jgi:moderate conductance mechanosensitive channel
MKPCYFRTFNLKYALINLLTLLLLIPMAAGWTQDMEGSVGWTSFGIGGDVAYAPVRLDGYNLFSIAADRKKGESGQGGLGNLQIRRNRIENRLQSQLQNLIARDIQPESLQVITTRLNKQIAVQAVIEGKATQPILTVTSLDAEIYGLSEAEVAQEYAQRIRQAFLRALQERQPAAQQSQLKGAVLGGAIATLLMALLFWGQRRIGKARRQLRQEFHNQQGSLTRQQITIAMDSDTTQALSDHRQQLFELKRRIEQKTWQKRILQLLWIGVGVVGLAWVLQRFPQTRSLGVLVVRQPIGLLLIGLSIVIAIICSRLLIDWLLTKWVGTEDQLPVAQIKRRRQRVPTLSAVWKQVITTLLVILGLLLVYSLFSFSTGLTLFTELGVLGVVVSLAFQSSIKDALAGWMLLARDAYTVGDIVAVKESAGVVEEMGLLMTQIRSSAGELITIRNGEIITVTNRSRDWARMDFTVLVDYDTDAKQAMTLMQDVFMAMQSDPAWGRKLIGEPDILGVEQFERDGMLLKLRTETQPGKQFDVTREFRFRLNQAFKDAGIKIPIPQREVRYRTSASIHPSSEAQS